MGRKNEDERMSKIKSEGKRQRKKMKERKLLEKVKICKKGRKQIKQRT